MSLLGLEDAPNTSSETATFQRNNNVAATVPPPQRTLGSCPDCGKLISQQAVTCPGCGRGFNNHSISRTGWSWTIAGGVIIGYLGITLINVIIFFVMLFFFAGLLANSLPNSNSSRPAVRSYSDR